MRKLTTEEFIEKIKKIHGDKYDYSKIDYKGNKVKVCFICPIHGEFWQRPNDSLYGMGCPKCGGTNKMTTEDFIKKAQIVHNNFFSYEKTIYKNSNEKIIVTCPIHGDFEVKANNHLNGVNCKQCQKEHIKHQIINLKQKNKSTKTYNTEQFIKKAKEVHGDKYDYSKTKYINNRTKVIVICLEHGEFQITPNHFLSGRGCVKCSKNYRYSTNEIINAFKKIHGDKYDYSKVDYTSTHTKVCIICPKHGEFWQTPANHLRGQGCSECSKKVKIIKPLLKTKNKKLYNTEEFIKKAKKIHGNKYDYSKVNYKNIDTKVCIICPEHGEFWQSPYLHQQGCGCPECGKLKSNKNKTLTTEDFINKSKEIHGDKYDYSKVEYINNHTKVCIICSEHGEFWQYPTAHLRGSGCAKCFNENKKNLYSLTTEEFIKKAKEVHGDKYDYSKVEYKNAHTKVCIICPEHGEFWQVADSHIRGLGCNKCGLIKIKEKKTLTTEDFIKQSQKVHGDKYIYDKSIYKSARDKILITCPKHGDFWQTADAHMRGSGCPSCSISQSKPENEIYDYVKNKLNINIEQRNRSIISPYELDLYLPDYNFAIEYNGLIWHSDKFNTEINYHLNKTLKCSENKINLIHIFEDEWLNKKEIVLSKISHILGCENKLKIFGRKTEIKTINRTDGIDFLNKYHIQGSGIASVYLGCFYKQNLIAVMSFKKEKEDSWELTRFASDYNYICCGVGGKLFKHFIKEYDPQVVKSFADRRWTVDEKNNLYIQLGFKFDGYTRPDYKYIKSGSMERYHKFGFRKQILLKKYPDVLNPNMTETEMTKELGYYKIYDCGLIRYIWKKN